MDWAVEKGDLGVDWVVMVVEKEGGVGERVGEGAEEGGGAGEGVEEGRLILQEGVGCNTAALSHNIYQSLEHQCSRRRKMHQCHCRKLARDNLEKKNK